MKRYHAEYPAGTPPKRKATCRRETARTASTRIRRAGRICVGGSLLLLGLAGCRDEAVRRFSGDFTPRERYEQSLLEAGLDSTALGEDWMEAAAEALDRAVTTAGGGSPSGDASLTTSPDTRAIRTVLALLRTAR